MSLRKKIGLLFTKTEFKRLFLLALGILVMGLLEVIGVTTIVPFMAVVVSPEIVFENAYLSQVYNYFNFQSVDDFIVFLGALLVCALLISNGFQAFMTWATTYFTNMLGARLSVRLLENYLMQPYSFFLNRNSSDLGKNILREVFRTTSGVIMQSLQVLSKTVVVLFLFSLLFFVDPIIAIASAVLLGGLYALIFTLVKIKLRKLGELTTKDNLESMKAMNQALSGVKDIKLSGAEKIFVGYFSQPTVSLAKYQSTQVLIGALPRYLLEVIAFGGVVVIVISLIAINKGVNSEVIPLISLYVMAGYRLLPAFQQIYSGISTLRFNMPSFELLTDEFSKTGYKKIPSDDLPALPFRDKLEIKKLDFNYEGSQSKVLNKLDLTIDHNTTVGLVGLTGSGKTTLIDIILGLLIQDSGTISVDGTDIDNKNRLAWQKNLGYVAQTIYLIDDTVLANIAFAIPLSEVSTEKVITAAKMANLHDFIMTLPDKYETFVGERGVRLSGGQRQRIGIARALYNNPDVLLLDEATNALDNITENVVMDSIYNLSHKKTIIMIAHRLSSVKGCDIIHFMSEGKIIISGKYEELIKDNEEFRRMAKGE